MPLTKYISEKRVFIFLLLLSLVPVWIVPYFLTADGPCHTYNAGILYDMLHGRTSFFARFFDLNTSPEPNWFTHAILVLLLHVCNAVVAEKLVITLAILLFASGFRQLLLGLTRQNPYFSLWVFPFVWQMALFMGFYNYILSLGCSLWISAWFITNYKQLNPSKTIVLALVFTLLFFMHLFGCFLSFAICGMYILLDATAAKDKARHLFLLLISALPCLLLIVNYLATGSSVNSDTGRPPFSDLLSDLNNLNSLAGPSRSDIWHAMKMSALLQIFIVSGLISFAFRKPDRKVLIPLSLLLAFTLAFFLMYETTLGGSHIRTRLEPLIYLFGILSIAFAQMPRSVVIVSACLSVYCSLAFTFSKLAPYRNISGFVSEIRGTSEYIADKSLVLPLNMERFLRDKNGDMINNNIPLFAHVAEAMPHDKQIIFLDNYEATTGYFPIIWKNEKNPFIHLAVGDGIEGEPPQVNIPGYNKNVHPIRYILLWGKKKEVVEHPEYPKLIQMVTDNYKLVYTSPVYKIGLYELK